jgi:hypothetical protein
MLTCKSGKGVRSREKGSGAVFMVVKVLRESRNRPANATVNQGLATTAAHELTHLMLNLGVGGQEHLFGDENRKYLMHENLNVLNWSTFLFDDMTRRNMSLKNKDFTRLL